MKPIKIMMLDRHEYFRASLIYALKTITGVRVIGEAARTAVLLKYLEKASPDVIFFDLDVYTMQHYNYMTLIKTQYPKVKVIALSMDTTNFVIGMAYKEGANCFLPKNTSIAQLEESISKVTQDKIQDRKFAIAPP